MNELAVRTTRTDLTITDDQTTFNGKQIAVLRQLGVEDASQADLALFFHVATRTGLDPFARQIYMIGRKEGQRVKQTIQTGIDGFRLIARRAADRAVETLEYRDAQWCDENGAWSDVWLSTTPPSAARVVVLRNGRAFPAVATFAEYKQTKFDGALTAMWRRMPSHQLEKCAEAAALRKAFPHDLGGLYIDDEMPTTIDGDVVPARPRVTAAEILGTVEVDRAEQVIAEADMVTAEQMELPE